MPDETSLYQIGWRKRDGSRLVTGYAIIRATSPEDAEAQFRAKHPSAELTGIDDREAIDPA